MHVAASMPPMTTVPRMRRDTAPAPLANHNGVEPRIKAKEVIRIGRKRIRAPVSAASTRDLPFSYSSRANSTMRIAFFAARPMSITRPICAKTLFTICLVARAAKAPTTAIGVPSRTLNGSDQLSYSAAKIKNTNRSESPKIAAGETPCCAFFSWKDIPR